MVRITSVPVSRNTGKRVLPLLENFLLARLMGLFRRTILSAIVSTFRTLCDEGGAHTLLYNCCELIESTYIIVYAEASEEVCMAAIQLLTTVVLNFMQFWKTSGQGQNRAFPVAVNYLGVAQVLLVAKHYVAIALR